MYIGTWHSEKSVAVTDQYHFALGGGGVSSVWFQSGWCDLGHFLVEVVCGWGNGLLVRDFGGAGECVDCRYSLSGGAVGGGRGE